jgi:hypothetical protein
MEEKTTRNFVISFRSAEIKMLGIPFQTILQERKTLGFFFRIIRQRKTFVTRSELFKDKEIIWGTFKKHFFSKLGSVPLYSVPNLGIDYAETHGIPRKEHRKPF